MNKQQWMAILAGLVLFFILYFGCEVKSKEQEILAQSLQLTAEAINMPERIADATAALPPGAKSRIQDLTRKAADKTPSVLKALSGAWHDLTQEDIAAWYAEQVADIEKTAAAWSIAGANYYLAIQQNTDQAIRDFCTQKAVSAFQNAASIDPTNLEHRINLALCYTENPPKDNPMKGILQLRDLEKENPDNAAINIQLARLAIKTGQFARAIERLEKLTAREPNNKRAFCLLAEAYRGAGDAKAEAAAQKCSSLQ